MDFAEQLQISGLARGSIKALGFLRSGSCVLQDFPSPEQMGCHINHEADDRYRLKGLIWETDHKTTPPSFCHLFPPTGGSASLRNSKPQPMSSQHRCLISLTFAANCIQINDQYYCGTKLTLHRSGWVLCWQQTQTKAYRFIIMEASVVQWAPKRSQRHNKFK